MSGLRGRSGRTDSARTCLFHSERKPEGELRHPRQIGREIRSSVVEYQITDFLRFQGSVAETSGGLQRSAFRRIERGGVDLIFFFSY